MRNGSLSVLLVIVLISACSVDKIPREYRDMGIPVDHLASPMAIESGDHLYQQHCSICHGVRLEGKGTQSDIDAADLRSESWRVKNSPLWIFYIIREGKSHSKMLGFKDKLTEMETWDIVAYILANQFE